MFYFNWETTSKENFDILFKILKKIKKNLILVFCTLIIVIDTIH